MNKHMKSYFYIFMLLDMFMLKKMATGKELNFLWITK